jgi:hypothetical protein
MLYPLSYTPTRPLYDAAPTTLGEKRFFFSTPVRMSRYSNRTNAARVFSRRRSNNKALPIVGILAIMIRNHAFKLPCSLQLSIRARGARLNVLPVRQGELSLMPACAPQQLLPHDVGQQLFQRNIALGSFQRSGNPNASLRL